MSFPFRTEFNGTVFDYVECGDCSSVFVDPIPDAATFERMYSKSAYHDHHYDGSETPHFVKSARLLRQFLPERATVLDYGCGLGGFLKSLEVVGFLPVGVEFDQQAADSAAARLNLSVYSVAAFQAMHQTAQFDAIHFGDVLEHLPDPMAVLQALLPRLKPGGLIFTEGPLETNPSFVFWAARIFGTLKRMLNTSAKGFRPPTHLWRVNARQQKQFFERLHASLDLVHWSIEETGWPYANGGAVKRTIAAFAIAVGGSRFMGITFGNRFCSIHRFGAVEADRPGTQRDSTNQLGPI